MVEMINTALMRTVMVAGRLRQRFSEERGQDLLEYALIGGVMGVFIVGLGAALTLTGAMQSMGCGIAEAINLNNVALVGCS